MNVIYLLASKEQLINPSSVVEMDIFSVGFVPPIPILDAVEHFSVKCKFPEKEQIISEPRNLCFDATTSKHK